MDRMVLECTCSMPSRRPSWERRDDKASVSLSSTGSSGDSSLSSLFQKESKARRGQGLPGFQETEGAFVRVGAEDRVKFSTFLRHGA